jgi:hypothetical protein
MRRDIVHVNFKISVPKSKWLAIYNKKYPELDFKILSNFILDNNIGDTLFQIKGSNIRNFITDFQNISDPATYQILAKGENFVLLDVKTIDPMIFNALVKTQLLLIYPLTVINGKIRVNAIAERSKIDHFLLELDKKDIKFTIESIGYYQKLELLTKRQNEILQYTDRAGYFEIPRKISLTDLAKKLNISPSALSETLRRINKKLTKFYLNSTTI